MAGSCGGRVRRHIGLTASATTTSARGDCSLDTLAGHLVFWLRSRLRRRYRLPLLLLFLRCLLRVWAEVAREQGIAVGGDGGRHHVMQASALRPLPIAAVRCAQVEQQLQPQGEAQAIAERAADRVPRRRGHRVQGLHQRLVVHDLARPAPPAGEHGLEVRRLLLLFLRAPLLLAAACLHPRVHPCGFLSHAPLPQVRREVRVAVRSAGAPAEQKSGHRVIGVFVCHAHTSF